MLVLVEGYVDAYYDTTRHVTRGEAGDDFKVQYEDFDVSRE